MATADPTCSESIPHARWNLPFRPLRRLTPQLMLAATLCLLGTGASADLPLSVESILADKGKTKLNLSLAYRNQGVPGAYNSDTVVGTASLRYGLTDKTEIYARWSGLHSNSRTSETSTTDRRFQSAWAGASYQFKKDTGTPALIGFVEGALVEQGREDTYALKSWAAGFTTYKSVDPIVFVFSGHYGLNLPRKDGEANISPGDTWLLNPSLAFSVNDRVALTAGVVWTNTWPRHSTEDNEESRQPFRETNTDLQLGVDYGFSDDNILNVTFSSNVSGSSGSALSLGWLHTF